MATIFERLKKQYINLYKESKRLITENEELKKENEKLNKEVVKKEKVTKWSLEYHHIYCELQKVINNNKKIYHHKNDLIVNTFTEILDEWVKKVDKDDEEDNS